MGIKAHIRICMLSSSSTCRLCDASLGQPFGTINRLNINIEYEYVWDNDKHRVLKLQIKVYWNTYEECEWIECEKDSSHWWRKEGWVIWFWSSCSYWVWFCHFSWVDWEADSYISSKFTILIKCLYREGFWVIFREFFDNISFSYFLKLFLPETIIILLVNIDGFLSLNAIIEYIMKRQLYFTYEIIWLK